MGCSSTRGSYYGKSLERVNVTLARGSVDSEVSKLGALTSKGLRTNSLSSAHCSTHAPTLGRQRTSTPATRPASTCAVTIATNTATTSPI